MRDYAECIQALLDGKKLYNNKFNHKFIHLVDGWQVNEKGEQKGYVFNSPENWEIYEEPKWYENIPAEGVPCRVRDYENDEWLRDIICEYVKDTNYPYITDESFWRYAEPMTKSEIQVWLDNAPE